MAHPKLQYLAPEYLACNPTWDLEDTPWKAGIVRPLRRIIYTLLGKDRDVRLLGCETLMVMARPERR